MTVRELIALAAGSARLLSIETGVIDGGAIPLEAIRAGVDAADSVFAVWPEPTELDGLGWRQLKGGALLRTGHVGKLFGVPCAGPAEAEVLFRQFGDRDAWDTPAH